MVRLMDAESLVNWVATNVDQELIAESLEKDVMLDALEAKDAAEYFGLELIDHLDRDKILGYLGVDA